MVVVVTGASGNIGSAILRELTAEGHEVRALARRRPDGTSDGVGSVSWVAADVGTDDLVPHLEGAEAVVHLAWRFQPTHRPEVTWHSNVVGTRRVLEACSRAGTPTVIGASSIAAYSPVDHDTPVDESWPTDGTSGAAYCREKAYVERLLDDFEAEHPDVRVVRLRPAFVFQRSASSEQRRIFGGALVRPWMMDPRRIPVLPVPRGLRLQAVHAGDVARAVLAAVERPVTGAFNLAGDGVLRRAELGELVGARTVDIPRHSCGMDSRRGGGSGRCRSPGPCSRRSSTCRSCPPNAPPASWGGSRSTRPPTRSGSCWTVPVCAAGAACRRCTAEPGRPTRCRRGPVGPTMSP
jgi:UDP-glucose 4-epimerase